jgi:hypothetical protein
MRSERGVAVAEAVMYVFESGDKTGYLTLDEAERQRIPQYKGAFLLRQPADEGEYIFVTPYVAVDRDGKLEAQFSLVDLENGLRALLALEVYAQFVEDVANNRPGRYEAKHILP